MPRVANDVGNDRLHPFVLNGCIGGLDLRQLFRYAWTSPNTMIGIIVGWLLSGRFEVVDGVIEIESERIAWMLKRMWVPASAMTLGHVVLGQDRRSLYRTRRHERVHVRQYERWGILFLPAYGLCSLVLFTAGRDGYRENPFEVEAYAVDELVD